MTPIDPSLPPETALSKIPGFDPRSAPVLGIDGHLAPVPPERLTADALRERFTSPPAWEPEIVAERRFTNRPKMNAAVLVPIVLRERPMVLLTERATHLNTHSGQVAFPGGKCDDTDVDVVDTALREAHEEIGLERSLVEVLGQMPTYTHRHHVRGDAGGRAGAAPLPNSPSTPYEVADAFEVPLDVLMNPANHHRHAVRHPTARREWYSMPYMDGSRPTVSSGARLPAMLRNLYRLLVA
jgi:8-oxo-dGTP pyrophosphatase MutT (NUDIX family)